MNHYPLHGAGSEVDLQRSRRRHSCCAALAILTTFLLLNGCDNKGAAELASAQVEEASRGMKDSVDAKNQVAPPQAGPVEERGRTLDEPVEYPGKKIKPIGDALPNQQKPAQ